MTYDRIRTKRILDEIRQDAQFMRLMDRLADRTCNDPACVERDCLIERMKREEA